jgi:hypothetical protein
MSPQIAECATLSYVAQKECLEVHELRHLSRRHSELQQRRRGQRRHPLWQRVALGVNRLRVDDANLQLRTSVAAPMTCGVCSDCCRTAIWCAAAGAWNCRHGACVCKRFTGSPPRRPASDVRGSIWVGIRRRLQQARLWKQILVCQLLVVVLRRRRPVRSWACCRGRSERHLLVIVMTAVSSVSGAASAELSIAVAGQRLTQSVGHT